MKCINFICLKEASGLKGIRGKFCKECLASSRPPVFECEICHNAFCKDVCSRIPSCCSMKCRNRRNYLRHGREWSRKNYKRKPRPKVAKLCLLCDEAFKCTQSGKFCSRKCARRYDHKYNAMSRIYRYTKKMVSQHLNLLKPQEVLYVPRH